MSGYGYEDYYDPSAADMLINELKERSKELILPNIKLELETLKSENEILKKENAEFKTKELQIYSMENELKKRGESLKKEVEDEFYNTNIGDQLERYVNNSELWFAGRYGVEKEKCELCDEDRNLVATYPNGDIIKKKCECNSKVYKYLPSEVGLNVLKFEKRSDSGRYQKKSFHIKRVYSSPSKEDFSSVEFNNILIFDKFDEEVIESRKNLDWDENICFVNKEDCDRFCEWLNSDIDIKFKGNIPKITSNIKAKNSEPSEDNCGKKKTFFDPF